jgi:hypothetical protein
MPYRLVRGLHELMSMDFDARPETDLTSAAANLPEEVYNKVDEISEMARELFGPGLRPNARQEFIMEDAGFPVKPGKTDMVSWKTGRIITPKGTVVFY